MEFVIIGVALLLCALVIGFGIFTAIFKYLVRIAVKITLEEIEKHSSKDDVYKPFR